MSSLFGAPKMPKTAMPTPEAQPLPEKKGGDDLARFMKKRSGRADTLMAGALKPMDIGKRSLLG